MRVRSKLILLLGFLLDPVIRGGGQAINLPLPPTVNQ